MSNEESGHGDRTYAPTFLKTAIILKYLYYFVGVTLRGRLAILQNEIAGYLNQKICLTISK
jgi:hypothetical protein